MTIKELEAAMVELNVEALTYEDLTRIKDLAVTLKEECEGEMSYRLEPPASDIDHD